MKKGFYAFLAVLILASIIGGTIDHARTIRIKPRPIELGTNDLSVQTTDDSTDGIAAEHRYILNTKSKRAHRPDCSGITSMKEENRLEYSGTLQELSEMGYEPCGTCKPQ